MKQAKLMTLKHCKFCKEGRVIENRTKEMVFCSLCGHEFRPK